MKKENMYLITYMHDNERHMELCKTKSGAKEFILNNERWFANWYVLSILEITDYELYVDDIFQDGMNIIMGGN